MPTLILTGAAGFIGYHVAMRLLQEQQGHTQGEGERQGDHWRIIGLDNLNDYYDPALKKARLAQLTSQPNFTFIEGDIGDRALIDQLFSQEQPTHILHLAAQAGVRYSLEAPQKYVDSNITGWLNILEACRHAKTTPQHILYASSSSVYGLNETQPFHESHRTASPTSLYGATKQANESMAHAYAHLFNLPLTGLRFFTVYGPWGRPDMVLFKFTRAMLAGQPIDVYNHGKMIRDFTYIDDVVESITRLLPLPPETTPQHTIYNVGNGQGVHLLAYIKHLENALGIEARLNKLPLQPGDVLATLADSSALAARTGYKPNTPLPMGLNKFVEWYREFYAVKYADKAAS